MIWLPSMQSDGAVRRHVHCHKMTRWVDGSLAIVLDCPEFLTERSGRTQSMIGEANLQCCTGTLSIYVVNRYQAPLSPDTCTDMYSLIKPSRYI